MNLNIHFSLSQLEKAREATDEANIRAAYAEVVTASLTGEGTSQKTVKLTQQVDGWTTEPNIAGSTDTNNTSVTSSGSPKKNGTCTVSISNNVVTLTYSN